MVNVFARQLCKARYPTLKSKPYVRFTSLVVFSHPWIIVVRVAVSVTMSIYKRKSKECLMIALWHGAYPFRKRFRKWKRHDNLIVRRRRIHFDTEVQMGVEAVEGSSDPMILEIEVGVDLFDIWRRFDHVRGDPTSDGEADVTSE